MAGHDAAPQVFCGSDQSGLICGYRFAADGRGQPIDSDTAIAWLGRAGDPLLPQADEFVWLHYSLGNINTEHLLRERLELPGPFLEALHESSRSTRIEHSDDALIAVVNDVLYDFAYEASEMSTLWAVVRPRLVVSVRRQPLRSIDRLRAAVKAGESFASAAALLTHLLRDQADVLIQIVREATAKVDQIEDRLLAGRLDRKRVSLGKLRRVFVRLRRMLAPEPGALFRLLNHPPPWLGEDDLQELRESTEEFSAVLNDLATLQERTKLLQEEMAAETNEQTNRSLFLLTMVTVLALPINMIAGLLGMNVGGIPFGDDAHGFLYIVALVASFTVVAGWYAFFKQRDDAS